MNNILFDSECIDRLDNCFWILNHRSLGYKKRTKQNNLDRDFDACFDS